MKIFHASPSEITKLSKSHVGPFGDVLFFSDDVYMMSAVSTFVYSIEVDESQMIDVSSLDDAESIADIAECFDLDLDDAESLLDGSASAFDFGLDGEDDWYIQRKQGEAARNMGCLVARGEDEQGAVYMFSGLNREELLTKEEV